MSTTQPIRHREQVEQLKDYYLTVKSNPRNYLLLTLGVNTALRVSDLLPLRWEDVYDFEEAKYRKHICIREKKTKKQNLLALNPTVIRALELYAAQAAREPGRYLFESSRGNGRPISRQQAFRLVREAAFGTGLSEHVSCHSLRKTFGYFAWQQNISPVLLMKIYNHSSFQVTKRYLGIEQDEKDEVYMKIQL